MTSIEALSRLQRLGAPVITSADAAVALGLSGSNTTHQLRRLEAAGQVRGLRRGKWWIGDRVDPLVLPEYLTAPYPSYVSLLTALNVRGVVDQIPDVVYVASLGPQGRVLTSVGTYSVHRLAPEVFGGFETLASGAKLATAEKALFDVAYLSATRSRLFAAVPELDLPEALDRTAIRRWLLRIESKRTRTLVRRALERMKVLPRRGAAR
jgi:predicted transcriptional regulator of viral defense system